MSDKKNETLKPGWRRVKFGDVIRLSKARSQDPLADGFDRYVGLEHLESGDLRIRDWGNVTDGVTFTNVFRPGQVLFGKRRAYQRKVALAEFAGICSSDIYVLETKDPETLLPELLPFICQSDAFFDHAIGTSAGSLSPRTNWSLLSEFSFSIPPSNTQSAILEAFRAAERARQTAVDLKSSAEQLLVSALTELYTKGTRGKPLISTAIGLIPSDWQVAELGEKYEIQLGKKLYNVLTEGDGQVPYLRNANIQWNRLDLGDVATMKFTERERNLYLLRPGDILACEGRHVGKAALWRGEIPEACYQMALHRLRPKVADQVPSFLLHCLRYYSLSGKFKAVTGETTIPHLPAEAFKKMIFPFPPADQQQEIAEAIDAVYTSIDSSRARAAAASAVLDSLSVDIWTETSN